MKFLKKVLNKGGLNRKQYDVVYHSIEDNKVTFKTGVTAPNISFTYADGHVDLKRVENGIVTWDMVEGRTDFEENDTTLQEANLSVIHNEITTISEVAFANCVNLQTVIIPFTLTRIGDYALSNCSNLQRIVYQGDYRTWMNSVAKGNGWKNGVPSTAQIICTDRTEPL